MSAHQPIPAFRGRLHFALRDAAGIFVAFAWTILATCVAADAVSLPDWRGAEGIALALPPALAAAGLVMGRIPSRALQRAAWWTVIAAGALLAAAYIDSAEVLALALPVLLLSAAACARRPAAATLVVFAISGFFGSLQAFFQYPTSSTVNLVLGSLWIGIPLGYALGTRTRGVHPWMPLLGIVLFVVITLLQLVTATGDNGALDAFMATTWFTAAIVVLAFAPWRTDTYMRIGRGIVAVALLVGGYATLRWIIGPADDEIAIAQYSSYNYSGDELKLLGSFPNGSDLGQWSAAIIPFCAAAAVWLPGLWRLAALLAMGLLAIAMLGSQLRVGLPGAAAGTVVVVLLWQMSRSLPGLRLGTVSVIALLAVLAGGVAFAVTGGSNDPNRSYSNILDPGNDPSFQARTYKWEQALRDLDDKPLGYGLGTATSGVAGAVGTNNRFLTNVGQQSVDSGYLKIALEQGFAVMVLYILALLTLVVGFARRAVAELDRQRAALLIGAAGTLVSFMVVLVTGAFQESLAAVAVWLVVGLGAAQAVGQPPRSRAAA